MVKSRTDSVNSDNSESVRFPRILVVAGIRGTGHTFLRTFLSPLVFSYNYGRAMKLSPDRMVI